MVLAGASSGLPSHAVASGATDGAVVDAPVVVQ